MYHDFAYVKELWTVSCRFYAKTDVISDGCLAFTFKSGPVLQVWFICMDTFAFSIGWINCNDKVRSCLDLFLVILSFPFAYCSRKKRRQYSLCSEAVSSRDQRSEWHIFERRYATAFHFVVSGGEALSSAHSPVI